MPHCSHFNLAASMTVTVASEEGEEEETSGEEADSSASILPAFRQSVSLSQILKRTQLIGQHPEENMQPTEEDISSRMKEEEDGTAHGGITSEEEEEEETKGEEAEEEAQHTTAACSLHTGLKRIGA